MLTKRIRKSSEILLGLSLSIRKPCGLDRLVASGLPWGKAEELENQSSWNSKSLWDKSLWAALSEPGSSQEPCSIQLEKMRDDS